VGGEEVVAAFDFKEFGVAGAGAIDGVGDGEAVGAAHDGVGGSVKHEDRNCDFLPDLSQIESLQLLIESGGAAVLAVGLVVPE